MIEFLEWRRGIMNSSKLTNQIRISVPSFKGCFSINHFTTFDSIVNHMKTTKGKINFGEYLHQLRMKHQLPKKVVADKLGIDISLLSKIEHGERFVQAHMLIGIAEMFELDY